MSSPLPLKKDLPLILKLIRAATKAFCSGVSNTPPRKLLILATLTVANISLVFYLAFRGSIAQETSDSIVNPLPAVEVIDDTGTRRSLSSLSGRIVVLQFINPEALNQVDSISQMLTKFGAEISFVLITRDSRELRGRLPSLPHSAIIIQHNYAELKRIFKVPDCCERRFIFDNEGKLGYHDYYYEADLTPRLNALLQRPLPPLSSALLESLDSLPNGLIFSAREMTRKTKSGKAVITIFTSVRTGCPSGEVVRVLNRYANKRTDVSFLTLLPKSYTNSDIDNFKSNLGVRFSVEREDEALSKEFGRLVALYGESRLNGIVVLIERGSTTVVDNPNEVELKLSQL